MVSNQPVSADRQELQDEFQSSAQKRVVLELSNRNVKFVPNKLRDIGISDEDTEKGVSFSILSVLVNGDPHMMRNLSKQDLQLLRERIDIKLMQYPD